MVVIPAHNEVRRLPRCLKSILTAAACVPVPVSVVVVLDSCDDGSARLGGQFGSDVHFIEVDVRSVGAARAAGFQHARKICATTGSDESGIWYATTDADTRVDPDWLIRQLASGADMVLGIVRIANWRQFPGRVIQRYLRAYDAKTDPDGGHRHIHGANMGFTAQSYWSVGGFADLSSEEDVDLVHRFEAAGHRVHRDAGLSVATSARQVGRAPNGFAAHLRKVSGKRRNGPHEEGQQSGEAVIV